MELERLVELGRLVEARVRSGCWHFYGYHHCRRQPAHCIHNGRLYNVPQCIHFSHNFRLRTLESPGRSSEIELCAERGRMG